jgi:hypothetical protein
MPAGYPCRSGGACNGHDHATRRHDENGTALRGQEPDQLNSGIRADTNGTLVKGKQITLIHCPQEDSSGPAKKERASNEEVFLEGLILVDPEKPARDSTTFGGMPITGIHDPPATAIFSEVATLSVWITKVLQRTGTTGQVVQERTHGSCRVQQPYAAEKIIG